MKVTTLGIITTLKDVGVYLASVSFMGIKADPYQFLYGLVVFCLINIPSSLFLWNHATTKAKEEAITKIENSIVEEGDSE